MRKLLLLFATACQPTTAPTAVNHAEVIDGILDSAPVVIEPAPGVYQIFVQGENNTLWWRTYQNDTFSQWTELDTDSTAKKIAASARPAAISLAPDQIWLFARHSDGTVWMRAQSAGSWGNWSSLGGWMTTDGLTAVAPDTNNVDVFIPGTNQSLQVNHWRRPLNLGPRKPPPPWSGWVTLPGVITSAPAAIVTATNRIDLFARDTNNRLSHTSTSDGGATWAAWNEDPSGRTFITGPALSAPTNQLHVYASGFDGQLYGSLYHTSLGWNAWQGIIFRPGAPTPFRGEPAVSLNPAGSCDEIFARGANNSFYHRGCGNLSEVQIDSSQGEEEHFITPGGITYPFNAAQLTATAPAQAALWETWWPKELLLFTNNVYEGVQPPPGSDNFWWMIDWIPDSDDIHYASLPGFSWSPNPADIIVDFPFSQHNTAVTTTWPARSARFVDHGTCRTHVPWFASQSDTPAQQACEPQHALFAGIDYGLACAEIAGANAQGADLAREMTAIQPSFLTQQGAFSPFENADGFSLQELVRFSKTIAGITGWVELEGIVSYRFTVENGLPAVSMVHDQPFVATNTNFTYDIASLLFYAYDLVGMFAMDVVFASTWHPLLNITPKTAPDTSTAMAAMTTALAETIPNQIRSNLLGQLTPFGTCALSDTPSTSATDCWNQRTDDFLTGVELALMSQGADPSTGPALVAPLTVDSFVCATTDPSPAPGTSGQCFFHPVAKRVNVLPDRLEVVWLDESDDQNRPDIKLIRVTAPTTYAEVCEPDAATHPTVAEAVLPSYIGQPTSYYQTWCTENVHPNCPSN